MVIVKTTLSFRTPTTLGGEKKDLCEEASCVYYLVAEDDTAMNSEHDIKDDEYTQFPLLVNDDGSQWTDANRYLYWKVTDNPEINHKTLYSIAGALKDFKNFCDEKGVDYLLAPRKILRPPWLYRKHLFRLSGKGEIRLSTIKGRLSALGGFYEWLAEIEKKDFKFPMYSKDIITVGYVDKYGNPKQKKVESKDIGRMSTGGDSHGDEEYIVDEGRLRPLTEKEQILLFEALSELENPEMFFGFLIALLTGARIQTVFTLRLSHFEVIKDGDGDVSILVGPGTKCDTKKDKLYRLNFPAWFYRSIQTYISSSRAKTRRSRSKVLRDENDQYVFLTRSGTPYYTSKEDIRNKLYEKPATGEAVRVFLYGRLKQWSEDRGVRLKFAFHDLRATFAVNYLFGSEYDGHKNTEVDMRIRLARLCVLMGHEFISTTERYLRFKVTPEEKAKIQTSFEKYIRSKINEY